MEYILEYADFLNEGNSPKVKIISTDSNCTLTVFIDEYKYQFYVNTFIINKFKSILRNSSGDAVNYMRQKAGQNYRRL